MLKCFWSLGAVWANFPLPAVEGSLRHRGRFHHGVVVPVVAGTILVRNEHRDAEWFYKKHAFSRHFFPTSQKQIWNHGLWWKGLFYLHHVLSCFPSPLSFSFIPSFISLLPLFLSALILPWPPPTKMFFLGTTQSHLAAYPDEKIALGIEGHVCTNMWDGFWVTPVPGPGHCPTSATCWYYLHIFV